MILRLTIHPPRPLTVRPDACEKCGASLAAETCAVCHWNAEFAIYHGEVIAALDRMLPDGTQTRPTPMSAFFVIAPMPPSKGKP